MQYCYDFEFASGSGRVCSRFAFVVDVVLSVHVAVEYINPKMKNGNREKINRMMKNTSTSYNSDEQ